MKLDTKQHNLSLPQLLDTVAREHPSATAVFFKGKVTDYDTLSRQSGRTAAALCDRGIRPGDRVALYCVNSDIFVIAYFAILKAGATVVTVNLLLNPKEIAYMINDSGAKAVIYSDVLKDKVSAFRETCPDLKFLVSIGEEKSHSSDLNFSDLLQLDAPVPAIACDTHEDVAVIIYTSGTTGQSKGAMLTHYNLTSNVQSVSTAIKTEPGKDIFLVVLPMFHSFAGTVGMLTPLLSGCAIVPLGRFDPKEVADTIESANATVFLGVPSMYNALLKLPDDYAHKLASLRYGLSGGAAMPQEVMKRFEERFGKVIYEGDGPTECSPVTCLNPIDGKRKPASVGLPIPGVEMNIMDEQGAEMPHNQIGEICVRGPNIMKGYWNKPEETKASMFGQWFRTGDLGTEDDEGYFYIVDRKKDMVIVNGMNVYPRMVEEVLYQFEPIYEAAVVGEPHESHGEIPVAYIAFKEGKSATPKEIRAFCQASLGQFQIPKKFIAMKELPKNASGKILKRELRKQGELERGVDSR
ncbi:MAG: long-chain fatty acid--CoA ligase [Candidatus Raymondbacteria bacterium RifOxyC12_full_50_8]|uniref:Long-chain fatty acid--CoA ligase n=1 Tax=Candidatus Raymondbacteria bacterium RIFOXYD12_FULL_49_13 TaxID=1817890 RepID=A0A1F7F6L4_UNCRA|nr:MAG: long-chain fatty acid--CoA ligase [Candidatus Raymondbacteria bacterium RIFOXYA2_FULL_49_16]OGJ95098.1 MAG: long-chain fatty acid--CoA ligase [Candidatus Raymondbacteria bacterium RifOxyC12_full_50_8]OGJ95389.1 MAG: long-chain fatty acid--CoA ligase [Candidatus Raymondbacteria bacterium RifOxyB12_full_50_8]OGK02281.1 MAG: long-chain fatty acid--CoA ligase [Candidatus Raymondbacteria bacterium RIFOXYD12_FULL_49_13]OGP45104.1 MAG: long-chain fatty acid--CoA ligase [Candidatus Raymondbacte